MRFRFEIAVHRSTIGRGHWFDKWTFNYTGWHQRAGMFVDPDSVLKLWTPFVLISLSWRLKLSRG